MAEAESSDAKRLNLEAVIGFGGAVQNGYVAHPNGRHVLFPLGSTVVIKDLQDNSQAFLQGHNADVSCVAVSSDGRFVASGESTHTGFKAHTIVWDFEAAVRNANSVSREGELLHRLVLHKVHVQSVAFSPNNEYLLTLGGRDDNNLVVWDVASGEPICGTPAANDTALCCSWFNNRSDAFISGGHYNLRLWDFDRSRRKLKPTDCIIGKLRRIFTCLALDDSDSFAYCGTQTGDLLKVNATNGRFVTTAKSRYEKGILCVRAVGEDKVFLGTGAGVVARLDVPSRNMPMVEDAKCSLQGGVTSIAPTASGGRAHCGTQRGNTYVVDFRTMEAELRGTSHHSHVNRVVFPDGCSDIFLTCAVGEIRIWNAARRQELLRIQVPNLECHTLALNADGRHIVSGWSDGKIRAFLPESGKLHYVIPDAHKNGATALAVCRSSDDIVTGGRDGRVRVWRIQRSKQTLLSTLKEHKGAILDLRITRDDSQCVSAAADGSCIVWDLERHVRLLALFASTQFRNVQYHPDESQLLTCGSDRKITYWDAVDGTAIRILEGSESELTTLDIEPDGILFATGGEDRIVKLWHYDEGYLYAQGEGHSGGIHDVIISPDQRHILSVGAEGALMVWTMPDLGARDLQAEGYEPHAGAEAGVGK